MAPIESELKCVVSGSFSKAKPEIDLAIEELTDLGVTVLAPEKGWLYKPPQRVILPEDRQFRPLPSEVSMNPGQVEDEFLRCITKSDFVYVVNPDGYVGDMVAFEIGFALANGVRVIALNPISTNLDEDPAWKARVSKIEVMQLEKVVLNTL